MKPKNIYLIRHGQSTGSVDRSVYKTTPDWKVPLTDKGIEQAKAVGTELKDIIGNASCAAYCSPWYRARQTAQQALKILKETSASISYKEDPRIREQEWGSYTVTEYKEKILRERYKFGTFFYRMPDGESGADVYDRVTTFLDTLYRDFQKEDFPENVLIFSHGLTIRVLIMRWLHFSVELFETLRTPKNCSIINLQLNDTTEKYELATTLELKKESEYIQHVNDFKNLFKKEPKI
jgi:broad specificity phosphatase PhoE